MAADRAVNLRTEPRSPEPLGPRQPPPRRGPGSQPTVRLAVLTDIVIRSSRHSALYALGAPPHGGTPSQAPLLDDAPALSRLAPTRQGVIDRRNPTNSRGSTGGSTVRASPAYLACLTHGGMRVRAWLGESVCAR